MRRFATACALAATLSGSALAAFASQTNPASACSLAPFGMASLIGRAPLVEVVAIGTVESPEGATIRLRVEEYNRAPEGRPATLVVNNLAYSTQSNCDPFATGQLSLEPGTRILALLDRDIEGVGANWRSPILPARVFPVVDDHVILGQGRFVEHIPLEHVRTALQVVGPALPPDPTVHETPAPVTKEMCTVGPYTLRYFARTAPIVVHGVIESTAGSSAALRVNKAFAGASGGDVLQVDNRNYSGGFDFCSERVSDPPLFHEGEEVLAFLTEEGADPSVGLRLAALNGYGVYRNHGDERWIYADFGLRTFDEATAIIEEELAARPAPSQSPSDTSGNASAASEDVAAAPANRGPGWLGLAFGAILFAAPVAWRWKR